MKIEENETSLVLGRVMQDVLGVKVVPETTVSDMFKGLYDIARKNGICQGTCSEDGNGRLCNNPEWVMLETAYWQRVHGQIEFMSLLGGEVPKDLLAYGKKPKRTK